uniref:Uncharacterized protein n=1 Tax=Arundo donax TaxID=35708 RepID=A0A0A9H2F8_ARUDO
MLNLRTKEFLVCPKLPKSSSKLGHHRPSNGNTNRIILTSTKCLHSISK